MLFGAGGPDGRLEDEKENTDKEAIEQRGRDPAEECGLKLSQRPNA